MTSKTAKRGLHALLRELSDDEADTTETGFDALDDPDQPWSRHFRAYIDTFEQVPDGWSTIKWWGVSVPPDTHYSPLTHVPGQFLTLPPCLGLTCTGLLIDHVIFRF